MIFKKTIGFIGCGNIAKIIISIMIKNKQIAPNNIWVYDHKIDTNRKMKQQYGIIEAQSAESLANKVDILFGAVKPTNILKVLYSLKNNLKENSLVISIAAGVTLDALASVLGKDRKIIRIMPNVSSLVNEGMTSVTPNKLVEQHEIAEVIKLFQSFGKAVVVSEDLIHAVIGISSSASIYVFMLIEAMADAAVLGGMSRSQAYQFASQTVKGSAQMVLETNKHPGELKDMVCSPGGTTIEALKVLEEQGFRAAIINAIQQCMIKSKELSNKIIN